MTPEPVYDVVLAHHPIIIAAPFVGSAVLIAGLLGGIVWRDRREDRSDRE